MTDKEALDILAKAKIDDIDTWSEAVYIATKRLEECQWHDYIPEKFRNDCRNNFGSKVILGIKYDDGSRGTVDGFVMYHMDIGYYLAIEKKDRIYLTEKAVIEKWMKYPDYN